MPAAAGSIALGTHRLPGWAAPVALWGWWDAAAGAYREAQAIG